MRIAVASGKGGTGKTFLATNLAAALPGAAYLDCDVEGANGAVFLKPDIETEEDALARVPVATDACTGCGTCAEVCRFGAVAALPTGPLVFGELCHSCGACVEACPEGALAWTSHRLGTLRRGTFRVGDGPPRKFADGELATGQIRAAGVIDQVKKSLDASEPMAVLDCPPGSGCAVVEALRGADLCLLATEPTPFGLSDLEQAAGVAAWLGVPHAVVINRADLAGTDARGFCREHGLPVALEIPYDDELARLGAQGRLATAELRRYREVFDDLAEALQGRAVELRQPSVEITGEFNETTDVDPDRSRCTDREPPEDLVQVAVVSGKGGTGKTCLAATLATAAESYVAADCDVDAANLHLLLSPENETATSFSGGYLARVDHDLCRGCGVCEGACTFGAITLTPRATVDPLLCEGCGMCAVVCPLAGTDEMPIELVPRLSGHAFVGDTEGMGLARGKLLAGGEASGKLVTLVRTLGEGRAGEAQAAGLMIDASPGMGCPVNAALTGTDFAVAVTEPSASGLHDLERVLDLAAWFKVPAAVVINKADVSPEMADAIEAACRERDVEVLARVPFDRAVPEALSRGELPAESPGPAGQALAEAAGKVLDRVRHLLTQKRT